MWFIRRIMKFSWIEKTSTDCVTTITNLKCAKYCRQSIEKNDVFRTCDVKRKYRKSIANRKIKWKKGQRETEDNLPI